MLSKFHVVIVCLILVSFGKLLIDFFIVNLLMLCQTLHPSNLLNSFACFFSSKIQTLHINFQSNLNSASPHTPCSQIPLRFDVFRPATFAEVCKLISESPDTHCDLDPIPCILLKCNSALLPTVATIINLSLASGVFPHQFKSSSVHPLLKKSNSDKKRTV